MPSGSLALALAVSLVAQNAEPKKVPEPKKDNPPAKAKAAPKAKQFRTTYVPDTTTPVSAGDNALVATKGHMELAVSDVYAAISKSDYDILESDLRTANYFGGIYDMVEQKRVVKIPGLTQASVLKIVNHGPSDRTWDTAEIKVLAGPLKDRTLWVSRRDLVRMVESKVEVKKRRR